jgi:putative FmdB family regulatory protein
MPIYEYKCSHCQARFEKLVRSKEPTNCIPPCPRCGGKDTERVMSAFARHGEAGVDREAIQAERSHAERMASITPKEQIDKWRSTRNKKT